MEQQNPFKNISLDDLLGVEQAPKAFKIAPSEGLCATPLHGFKPSHVELQKEQPWHREVLLLKAQGFTNRRIAEEMGRDVNTISYVVRQTWFHEKLVQLLHEKGEDGIEARLQLLSKEAVEVAAELMRGADSERTRAQCAFELIKASRGQKLVVVEGDGKSLDALTAEAQKLQDEIKELQGEPVNRLSSTQAGGTN